MNQVVRLAVCTITALALAGCSCVPLIPVDGVSGTARFVSCLAVDAVRNIPPTKPTE